MGCGSSGELELPTLPPEPVDPIVVKGGKDGINVILGTNTTTSQPTVRYLGEIENQGLQPYCFIDITFSTLNTNGDPIDQGQARAELNGVTLTIFNNEENTCLRPGQFGSFDTGEINLTEDFASNFDYRICFKNDIERCQNFASAQDPRVPLKDIDGLALEDSNGLGTFRGRIKNNTTVANFIPYDVKVHFTILNDQGKVIDTVISTSLKADSSAKPCGTLGISAPNNLLCLGPGDSTEEFTVQTHTLFTEICDTCFYFRIYRSECVPGSPCPN
jgi:hypothetical protein